MLTDATPDPADDAKATPGANGMCRRCGKRPVSGHSVSRCETCLSVARRSMRESARVNVASEMRVVRARVKMLSVMAEILDAGGLTLAEWDDVLDGLHRTARRSCELVITYTAPAGAADGKPITERGDDE